MSLITKKDAAIDLFIPTRVVAIYEDIRQLIEMPRTVQTCNTIMLFFRNLTKSICDNVINVDEITRCQPVFRSLLCLCENYVTIVNKNVYGKILHFCYMLNILSSDCTAIAEYFSQIAILGISNGLSYKKSFTLLLFSVGIYDSEYRFCEEHCEETLEYLLQSCLKQQWKTLVLFFIILHPQAKLISKTRNFALGLLPWFTYQHVNEFFKSTVDKHRMLATCMFANICENHVWPWTPNDIMTNGYLSEICNYDMEYHPHYRFALYKVILIIPPRFLPILVDVPGFLTNLVHIIKYDMEFLPHPQILIQHIRCMSEVSSIVHKNDLEIKIPVVENRVVNFLYSKLSSWLEEKRKIFPFYHIIDIIEKDIISSIES